MYECSREKAGRGFILNAPIYFCAKETEDSIPKKTGKHTRMKFCAKCNNMLYAISETEGGAFYSCRKCTYREPITKENPLVYSRSLKESTTANLTINPYLKQDPTLPRFKTIACPNASCPTKSGVPNDVVGVKIDAVHVTWMYQCAVCDTTWKQNAQSGV